MTDHYICVELLGRSDCPRDRVLGRDGRFIERSHGMHEAALFESPDEGKAAGCKAPNKRDGGLVSSWIFTPTDWERARMPEPATEPTEQGNQYVIPGCEKDKTRGSKQTDLF